MKYTLYYHGDCADCANQAATTRRLDWLNRIHSSTDTPPSGELNKGEIALVSEHGEVFTHGYAMRKICLNVPAYFPLGLLLFFPPFLHLASKGRAGCNGDRCDLSA